MDRNEILALLDTLKDWEQEEIQEIKDMIPQQIPPENMEHYFAVVQGVVENYNKEKEQLDEDYSQDLSSIEQELKMAIKEEEREEATIALDDATSLLSQM